MTELAWLLAGAGWLTAGIVIWAWWRMWSERNEIIQEVTFARQVREEERWRQSWAGHK
jgi:hypothetical protein